MVRGGGVVVAAMDSALQGSLGSCMALTVELHVEHVQVRNVLVKTAAGRLFESGTRAPANRALDFLCHQRHVCGAMQLFC
jgi:hypothetical protein